MGPGAHRSAPASEPPAGHGTGRAVAGVLVLTTAGALLVACSVPTSSSGSAPPEASVAGPRTPGAEAAPTAEAGPGRDPAGEAFTVGGRREGAIAVAEATEHHVEAATLTLAEAGVTYVVHAACTGAGWMRYRLTVDDVELSASRLRCGRHVVDTAFTATGGERVQLHLDAPARRGEEGLAQVAPAP